MPTPPTPRRDTLNIRIRPEDRSLIDHGARAAGKNRTDFVLDAARDAAQEAILDRVLFNVDVATFERFQAMLDAPARPNSRLRKTLGAPPPWKRG